MAEEKKTNTAPSKNAAPAKAVTAVKKDEKKPGFFKRIGKWFREMKSELKKVVWPTPKVLAKNSLIALGMMVASAVVIWGFDELAQMLVRALFTLAG
ncbi:MAG: preprotein translocase subunit SecE [Candidatus Limivicinus sp.]|jgi:preprotein translocase subunit SecE